MKPNKSLLYLLPLIKGWSAEADFPLNCYSNTVFKGCLVVLYKEDAKPHNGGMILENEDNQNLVVHFIDDAYMEDYELIMKGKFSKINSDVKLLILEKVPAELFNAVEGVLYKSSKVRKYLESKLEIANLDEYIDEYSSKFGEEEIFKLETV